MTSVCCLRPQLGILEARGIESRVDRCRTSSAGRRNCHPLKANGRRYRSAEYKCADEPPQERIDLPRTSMSAWSPQLPTVQQQGAERPKIRAATATLSEYNAESPLQCADMPVEAIDMLAAQLVQDGLGARFIAEMGSFSDAESLARIAANEASRELQRERILRRNSERSTYLVAAIASSIGFTSLAAGAVVYRFVSQMQAGGEIPYMEIGGTFALAIGAAVGMEFWARWAHRALWHASLWHMHESHHVPRTGPFELNDIFAIINAGPAILLLAYGFFTKGFFPGLCFGAGLGITLFGISYMFVHDGLVHRRFPVGPIADVPFFQRVAAAHKLHHADKFKGVPYGLFLGPQELKAVGGLSDLEEMLAASKQAAALEGKGGKSPVSG